MISPVMCASPTKYENALVTSCANLLNMIRKLEEIDQEHQRGYISIFLIRYALTLKEADQELQSTFLTRYTLESWEVDQELRRGRMSIFLIRYVLKA